MAPSNLGLILFVLALARGATVVLQISLKAMKAKETQAWLSAWCWMRFRPTQSDGSVPHPSPNPLVSLLGDRLSGKILCVYNEKYNLFFHMDYRQWYKSCRRSDFKCMKRNKGNMGQRGGALTRKHMREEGLNVMSRYACASQHWLVKAFLKKQTTKKNRHNSQFISATGLVLSFWSFVTPNHLRTKVEEFWIQHHR